MADSAGGKEKLGYLGLGLMGLPMTKRLLGAGYEVAVWNRSPGKVNALVEAGARQPPAHVMLRARQYHLYVPHRCSGGGGA